MTYPSLAEAEAPLRAYNAAFEHALATGDPSGLPYELSAAPVPADDAPYAVPCVGCEDYFEPPGLVLYDGEHYCADCEPELHAILAARS